MYTFLKSLLFSPALNWIGLAVLVGIAIMACVAYYRNGTDARRIHLYWKLALGATLFRIVFAGIKTWLQYYAWLESEMSKYLLPPHRSIFYLLQYGWTHFMLNAVISIGAALLFLGILLLLQRHRERYFEAGEVELGALMVLVVGWPGFLVFIPVVFLAVVLISIIRGILWKEAYTTLGLPFFIAALVSLGFTPALIAFFKLAAFSI